MWKLLIIIFAFSNILFSQDLELPLEKSQYTKLTSYEELISFLEQICENRKIFELEYIGNSVEGRKIPLIKISSGNFGEDESKIKILVFAQQHGNEQSGKEGSLLLIKKFASGEIDSLLERVDILLIPQVNPDGSEINTRRNANNADLNRDHLTLLQPETTALHKTFNTYLPEVTLDVHEYYPYSESWEKYGYRKNFDEQYGTTTNINISERIREYSIKEFLTFAENFLNEKGFSFHSYMVGGPPEEGLLRYSTVDINDGRQSFGILNSFSFILEGKNGRDSIENIKRRAEGQSIAIQALLEFVYRNKNEIKSLIKDERNKLINSSEGEKVSIRMDHFPEEKLNIVFKSVSTGLDTTVMVDNFHTKVKSLLEVEKPLGYLIPANDKELISWMHRHNIKNYSYKPSLAHKVEQYKISSIDSVYLEGLYLHNIKADIDEQEVKGDYFLIPLNQLHSNMIVLALEPESMLGLHQYKKFEYLIEENLYPILKISTK
jgi:hypothetical protein